MERPSHITIPTFCPVSCRMAWSVVAVAVPLCLLWALALEKTHHGFAYNPPDLQARVLDTVKAKIPPPPPSMTSVPPVTAVPPRIVIAPAPNNDAPLQTTVAPITPPRTETMPVAGPDRAPVSLPATHTIPPYPSLAQRLGAEGTVTLRLTVLTDGKVGQAQIVTSSGRSDLDEAAQSWIISHWAYKPALNNGQPVVGETTAMVIFSLH